MFPKKNGPRLVLVTGAASGLGLELAKQFLDNGDRVILTDIHASAPDSLNQLDQLSGDWSYRALEVTSEDDWNAVAEDIDELDVLISNAGIAVGGSVDSTSLETWQRALDINLLGSVRGVRALSPKIAKGGRISLTASLAGLVHAPSMATYNTTKAATVALGETLDAELRHRKISVSVICPQFFKSGLASSLTGDDESADDLARWLLNNTWLDAATIARRAVKGIEARRVVVTPDAFAAFNWYSKRFTRIPHLMAVRAIGWGVAKQQQRTQKNTKR
ncbi:MAG: SDR family NAD(P)-dependent oxidoreductase [Corynebacterium sp.]|uniref:SDR family NAD(P)-dependent oxidoreductase n=1 Tax=Corynebacterium TaxID=1716 RepID=UPI002649E4B6|nr:SDR family NAD(P)-dependent oxidoreductase [Corynebacterium sp.]MDN5723586.1 SDR family NAD(P)-dependent oxidoreductase [Corynebacterium sp.]MDN6282843.1 SDR family NAD(P)-dependent oxidoreductase [Corynebacterium sp.]MDN6306369.1 SDR family NAD(P)-dependent oxidoreductase [Corynebacterium sp.]MDN6368795.1 SDR family NAD(P)-dependent oxidoreductase [Corynebacterium sp.]MDN6376045.1 SDR family NAD(P)-dependent oxidoreductase [Corynebacterium sp.]